MFSGWSYSCAVACCGYLPSNQNVLICTTHIKKIIPNLFLYSEKQNNWEIRTGQKFRLTQVPQPWIQLLMAVTRKITWWSLNKWGQCGSCWAQVFLQDVTAALQWKIMSLFHEENIKLCLDARRCLIDNFLSFVFSFSTTWSWQRRTISGSLSPKDIFEALPQKLHHSSLTSRGTPATSTRDHFKVLKMRLRRRKDGSVFTFYATGF